VSVFTVNVPLPHLVHDSVWSLLSFVEYRIFGLTIAFLPPLLLVFERFEHFERFNRAERLYAIRFIHN